MQFWQNGLPEMKVSSSYLDIIYQTRNLYLTVINVDAERIALIEAFVFYAIM
jgi:hypothetical protein